MSVRHRVIAVVKGAREAGIEVARIEVGKDGGIAIIPGKPTEPTNANALDEWMAKNARPA